MKYKFHMFGVIRSYQKLTGFQPVELKDECLRKLDNVIIM